ncbi:hypothetical protein GCM10010245_06290 [Streptomyces spectabilis]|nr:hypothetical protein GCM10010245_06290 [Streptomyces spectabilis]
MRTGLSVPRAEAGAPAPSVTAAAIPAATSTFIERERRAVRMSMAPCWPRARAGTMGAIKRISWGITPTTPARAPPEGPEDPGRG